MKKDHASPTQISPPTQIGQLSRYARLFALLRRVRPHHSTPLAHQLGRAGERYVERILVKEGMRVLNRNWRAGRLELDLVLVEPRGGTIVFVEVKTRQGERGGCTRGYEEISLLAPEQETRLIDASDRYLMRYSLPLKRMRVRAYRLELVGVREVYGGRDWGFEVVLRKVIVRGVLKRRG